MNGKPSKVLSIQKLLIFDHTLLKDILHDLKVIMNIEFFQNPPFVGGLLKQAPIKIYGFGFILLIKGLGFILFDSPSNINLNGISLLVFYYFPRISIQVVLKRNFLFKKQTFCHFLHKMFTYLKKNHEISYFAKLHPSGK